MRRLLLLLACFCLVPAQAQAAWPELWNSISVGPGQISVLAIPAAGQTVSEFSDAVECQSENGCTLTILGSGAGSYSVMRLDDREDVTANYGDTDVDLVDGDEVINLTNGRSYRLQVNIAATAVGTAMISGN